jgi:3,4-dihydroxy 2-butanone 4-phosphate synthase
MPAELNGLPANGTGNGINGHANELSNPTPADSAFDSIPDVVAAFGQHVHSALQHTHR